MPKQDGVPRASDLSTAGSGLYLCAKVPISGTSSPVSATVLIAPYAHLSGLKAQEELGDAITFSDHDALRALELITDQRPNLVAIDYLFAVTSRGTALIDRIKADPALTACEVRIVAFDQRNPTSPQMPPPVEHHAAAAFRDPEPSDEPLDHGTRKGHRFAMVEGVDVMIDGNSAALRDLSHGGAMVTSPIALRPNQRVRVSLPDSRRPIRFNAIVAWARFELFNGSPRYRAGLEFIDADAHAVQRFIDAHAVESFITASKRA